MSDREDFEAAYMRDLVGSSAEDASLWLERGSDGEYRSYQARGAYWGWKAGVAALVIGLPKRCDKFDGIAVESEDGDFYHHHDIREAIEAAGVKCK